MVNIDDLTPRQDSSQDSTQLDSKLDADMSRAASQERSNTSYAPRQETPSAIPRKCHSWIKNCGLFAVLLLLFLSLLDMSNILVLQWHSMSLSIWYIFASLLILFFLFFVRGFVGKTIVGLLFLLIVGGLSAIGVYHGFVHTPDTGSQSFSYTASSGVESISLSVDSVIAHTYIQGVGRSGTSIDYVGDKTIIDSWEDDSISIREENSWSVLDAMDSSIHIMLGSPMDYVLSLRGIVHRNFSDLTNTDWDSISFQAIWNDVSLVLDDRPGDSIIIKGRYAGATLNVPQDIGINLYYDKLVGSLAIQDFIMINKHHYQSSNYMEAKERVDIFVDSIVGKVRIQRN